MKYMRTTLEIPRQLLEEAKKSIGVKTKTQAVIIALKEVINNKKIEKLRALRGKLNLYVDIDKLRSDVKRR